MDVAVLDEMTARLEGFAVSARDNRSAAAHRIDVARAEPMPQAALDFNSIPGEMPHDATGKETMRARADVNRIGRPQFPGDAGEVDPGDVVQIHHGVIEPGDLDVSFARIGRWVEEDLQSRAVQVPFAR